MWRGNIGIFIHRRSQCPAPSTAAVSPWPPPSPHRSSWQDGATYHHPEGDVVDRRQLRAGDDDRGLEARRLARQTLGARTSAQLFGSDRTEILLAKFRPQVRPLTATFATSGIR